MSNFQLYDLKIAGLKCAVVQGLPLAAESSVGFAEVVLADRPDIAISQNDENVEYGGIPAAARAGFSALSARDFDATAFMKSIERIRGRPRAGKDQLQNDDIALLGLSTGLDWLEKAGQLPADCRQWFLGIATEAGDPAAWTYRARQLSADLLDHSGRLRADPNNRPDVLALDLVLRSRWTDAFASVPPISLEQRRTLMSEILSSAAPTGGELERAVTWLAAFDLLVKRMAVDLVPDFDSLVETLKATQSAMRRWVWEEKPKRRDVSPARWLIDTEAHVQALLWAILEPRFGDELRDEQFLPGYGQLQPRFDFGVENLKTIVEVKIARTAQDFTNIEEEVAGDLGIYFSDPARYDKMVVFVYDDSDIFKTERYDTLRSALKARDNRLYDVVIVQRPSMIPGRKDRGA